MALMAGTLARSSEIEFFTSTHSAAISSPFAPAAATATAEADRAGSAICGKKIAGRLGSPFNPLSQGFLVTPDGQYGPHMTLCAVSRRWD
jgi:hypothetical protein